MGEGLRQTGTLTWTNSPLSNYPATESLCTTLAASIGEVPPTPLGQPLPSRLQLVPFAVTSGRSPQLRTKAYFSLLPPSFSLCISVFLFLSQSPFLSPFLSLYLNKTQLKVYLHGVFICLLPAMGTVGSFRQGPSHADFFVSLCISLSSEAPTPK